MTLVNILIFVSLAVPIGFVRSDRWRTVLLLAVSVFAIYYLQPALPIRGFDFLLPTLTLALITGSWILTTKHENRSWVANWPGLIIPGGIILGLSLTRYLSISIPLTASRPPQAITVLAILAAIFLIGMALSKIRNTGKTTLTILVMLILVLFIVMKMPLASLQLSIWLRSLTGQALATASALDIQWIGFSYIAFRIIHTIRDRQTGRLPEVNLQEYIVFVIFFPAISAGPLDRLERFLMDLRKPSVRSAVDWGEAGQRILLGLFKKFVIADGLALIALNPTNAVQVRDTGWAWVLVVAYSLQIYFDFSGYTDIAIGIGRLLGFKLPENFNHPYLKPNLTQFWNNWHMTLTQWFRAYYFNPLTRKLRSGKKPLPIPAIIFLTQMSTMLLIGLWHGITWNFILWGLWHGIGLFINNRWSERTKTRFAGYPIKVQHGLNYLGTLFTFTVVTFGWVVFSLPETHISLEYMKVLLGIVKNGL